MTAPTRIGKYEIRRQIGRGAMGVVYEAFDPVIERRVAVKTLRLEIFDASQTSDVRARFKREAQAAGQLAHPHIVTVYDYGESEGTPYIAMEFLAGNELSQILNRGTRLPLSETVRLMTQLLGALSYAHERKVVHRDVKPGNIFILDDGSLKVVDFGLAHVEASNLTDTGALLGTPAYMSPEQFLALAVDERSDIFSAGVILYELLTGDKPFTGSVTSIMQKVLRQEPMEPSVLNPTLSATWDVVVKRAMAKKPDARFQTARQFSETVKQVFEKGALNVSVEVTLTGDKAATDLGGATVRSRSIGASSQPHSQPPNLDSAQQSTNSVHTKSPTSTRSDRWRNAGLALAVVVFVTIFWGWRREEDAAQRDSAAAVKAILDQKAAAEKAAQEAKAAKERVAQEGKLALERAAQEKAAEAKKAVGVSASRLPRCVGEFNPATWTDCFGTYQWMQGATIPNHPQKYIGEWKGGKRHGHGTLTLFNGEKYVGEFRNDMYHGQGTLYRQNGSVLQTGNWQNGFILVRGSPTTRLASAESHPDKKAAAKAAEEEERKARDAVVARLEKLKAEKAEEERKAAEKAAAEVKEKATASANLLPRSWKMLDRNILISVRIYGETLRFEETKSGFPCNFPALNEVRGEAKLQGSSSKYVGSKHTAVSCAPTYRRCDLYSAIEFTSVSSIRIEGMVEQVEIEYSSCDVRRRWSENFVWVPQ